MSQIPKKVALHSYFKIILGLLTFGFIIECLLIGSQIGVRKLLETGLKAQVQGVFLPHPFAFQFQLNKASFEVMNKAQVSDADLKVSYQMHALWPRPASRVQLESHHANLQMKDQSLGQELSKKGPLTDFFADFEIDSSGIKAIYDFRIASQNYNFQLKQTSHQ